MVRLLWQRSEVIIGWEGKHPISGAGVAVGECGAPEGPEEWNYTFLLKRNKDQAVVHSDELYQTPQEAMRAAEALFDAEGRLIDEETVFRRAFARQMKIISDLDQPDLDQPDLDQPDLDPFTE